MNKILFHPHQFVGVADMDALQDNIEDFARKHNMEVVSIDGFVYDGLEVKALATPAMGFIIEPGSAWLLYHNLCNYNDFDDGAVPEAHASLPRIDLVAVKHSTKETDEVNVAFRHPTTKDIYYEAKNVRVKNYFELVYIAGTPSEAPTAPDIPADCLGLALIDVNAGVTEILQENITDIREMKPDYLVSSHRTENPIDHPAGSIFNLHIADGANIALTKLNGLGFSSLETLIKFSTFIGLPGETNYSYNIEGRLETAYYPQRGILETFVYDEGTGRISETIVENESWIMTEAYVFVSGRIADEIRVLEAKP